MAKARAKAKEAEIDSEVNSDGDNSKAGKRKTKRKIFYDTDDTHSDDESVVLLQYPKPPGSTIKTHTTSKSSHQSFNSLFVVSVLPFPVQANKLCNVLDSNIIPT